MRLCYERKREKEKTREGLKRPTKRENKEGREGERGYNKRHSDNVRTGTTRRAKGVGNPRASVRAGANGDRLH